MATSTLGSGTLVLAGTTSGTTTVTATAVAGTTTLTLPAATDTLVGKATTDTLTNKTLTGAVMNGTLGATTPSTASVTTLTTSSTITHNGGTANGVPYLNGSKVLTTGSALTYDGTKLTSSASGAISGVFNRNTSSGATLDIQVVGGSVGTLGSDTGGNGRFDIVAATALQLRAASAFMLFDTNGSTRMTLDASGNLGVGTTSPATKLHVYSSGANARVENSNATTSTQFQVKNTVGTVTLGLDSSTGGGFGVANAAVLWYDAAHPLLFGTNNIERARIDSSGNLLVGDTTPAAGTARVYIKGDATNPAFRALANTTTTSVYAGVFRHESTTAGAYIQFVTDSNVETGRIYDLAGTMQYASSSDARLKTNVQPMQNGLQSVLALNPCTFDMRRGENTFISSSGLIAQEVHQIYPFVVGVGGDDENTNPWSVDYGKLTPLLVAAIKEQQALITQLTARITALEGA
jgi:hypothetical protein